MSGMIFDIQRFSIHDGPGIRTTVFLKGCPLDCVWCHNPESKSRRPQLSFNPERCIGCGACFQRCPHGVHRQEDGEHRLDRVRCEVCGICVETCYAEALELVGREMEAAEVVAEVLKDEPFYETSGGGMTLSGGEPLLQPDFIAEVLESAQAAGLHTAMETCGHADRTAFERIRSLVDLFFYDVKETDPERHRRFTGVDNALILDNLAWLHGTGSRVIVRLPLVPGLNDTEAHFRGIAALARKLPDLDGFEIMPYHRLGESKLDRLGIPREGRPDCEAPPPEMIDGWSERLLELGVPLLNEKQA